MKVTITNEFHNSHVTLEVPGLPCELTEYQIRRARNTLCGITDCTCGGPLGERGKQNVRVEEIAPGRVELSDQEAT